MTRLWSQNPLPDSFRRASGLIKDYDGFKLPFFAQKEVPSICSICSCLMIMALKGKVELDFTVEDIKKYAKRYDVTASHELRMGECVKVLADAGVHSRFSIVSIDDLRKRITWPIIVRLSQYRPDGSEYGGHAVVIARCSSRGEWVCLDPKTKPPLYIDLAKFPEYPLPSATLPLRLTGQIVEVV